MTTAVYVLNQSRTKSVEGKTSFQAWYGKKPAVHHLHTFGCIVHVKLTTPNMKKFNDRSKPMIFIGYEPGSKAYRAYDPTTRRVHGTRDVVFDEMVQWDWDADNELEESGGDDTFMVEMEYTTIIQASPVTESTVETPGASTPVVSPSPSPFPDFAPGQSTTLGLASATTVEFASPPSVRDGNLDADHDNTPLRFRKLEDMIGPVTLRGFAPRVLAIKELHVVSSDEPVSFAKAERHSS